MIYLKFFHKPKSQRLFNPIWKKFLIVYKKVFENIHEVEFDPSKKIIAMYSAEKEKIDFVKPVNPVGKNVEDWMGELET